MSASIYYQSGQVVLDNNGAVAPGAKLYFFDATTTTPRTTYSDADLTSQRTHPVVADGYGRIPVIYLAYGSFDVKLTTSGGTQLFYQTDIANPAPFDDTTTFDTTTVLTTGDIFCSLINGLRTGAVRLNGRTIGNVTSSATERANDDTINLFAFIWNNCANAQAAVSGGRGISAAVDFAASKRITLPDYRACALVGFDDMGNTAASLLGSAPVVSGSTILGGSILGANTHTLTTAQLPSVTPAGTISQITPAGTVASVTPTGSVAAPTFTGTLATLTATGTVGITDNRTWATTNSIYSTGANGARAAGTEFSLSAAAQSVTTTGGSISGSFTGTGFSYTPAGSNSAPAFTGNALASQAFTGTPTTPTFTGSSFGSGTAHNNLARSGLVTWFIKL
jgi:hypothetical protein